MNVAVRMLCAAAIALAAVAVATGCSEEGNEPGTSAAAQANAQVTCPVMGGKIDKAFFADYDGKRVYFCCAECVAQFKKDPAKYVNKLEDAGVVLEKTPQAPC